METRTTDGLNARQQQIVSVAAAYTGFPRSLNGINVLMEVLQKRSREGIKDEVGKEPGPLP